MTTIDDELKDCAVFLLAKAYQRAHGEFKRLLEPHGLTNLQHLVVEALVCEPGQTAVELGKILILDKATLSGVIKRLHESGWIEKRAAAEDARTQRLYPTESALLAAQAMTEERKRFDAVFLGRLSLEERLLLKRLLRDLIW